MKLATAVKIESDNDYSHLENHIKMRVSYLNSPLFTTDVEGLFETYLEGIPEQYRQHYRCHACKKFIEKYGGLVTINEEGTTFASVVNDINISNFFFNSSFSVMANKVRKAKVTGVFYSSDKVWGTPITGEWTHLFGMPKPENVYSDPLKNASQGMAEKKEDYGMLCRGLAEYPIEAAVQAVRVLEADILDKSEKTLGVAKWFLKLHNKIKDVKGPTRNNIIWLAVAKAPPGWCHVKSTMINTLLDDVVLGLDFAVIKSRWASKMHPLQYQRPTTIKEGNLKQANEVVEKLGSAGSLARRFAKLEDILNPLWLPKQEVEITEVGKGKPFDHLMEQKTKIKEVQLPPMNITWDKFSKEVLPNALKMEIFVPYGNLPFFGLVTAVNKDSPPILQWDGLTQFVSESTKKDMMVTLPRNPVSWYFYYQGSPATNWNLIPNNWIKVNAVCDKPCHWQDKEKFLSQGEDVMFILDGAKDINHKAGGSFFPECLKSEYHIIRAAMEAYSNKAEIQGKNEGTANGIALQGGSLKVRVKTKDVNCTEYSVKYR